MTDEPRELYFVCGQDLLAPAGVALFAAPPDTAPPGAATLPPTGATGVAGSAPAEPLYRDYEWADKAYRAIRLDEAEASAAEELGWRRLAVRQALSELEPAATFCRTTTCSYPRPGVCALSRIVPATR